MGRGGDNQADWFPLAAALASDGYTVLTFDRRGVCVDGIAGCSEGNPGYELAWRDVVGAVSFLEGRGFRRIFIGGASIGAMASLRAAEKLGDRVSGVIWVAGLRDASSSAQTSPP